MIGDRVVAPFALIAPGGGAAATIAPLDGIEWGAAVRAPFVPLELDGLDVDIVHVQNGIVPVFGDPFSTYRVEGVEVTVYQSNYDGALLRGGKLHPGLLATIASRYGVHRWSDPQWKS
ncbi:hypothetical protein [Microbacterium lacus]|uniref:hypothetical protein n=1 Tax=Microbacterium lacus TaxID=415217 RepID=UPI000C2BFB4A|nr:hypothetical protein [Microbacterium lacus]